MATAPPTKGDRVWIPDDAGAFLPCTVKEAKGGEWNVLQYGSECWLADWV
jgi:hypothetical protein